MKAETTRRAYLVEAAVVLVLARLALRLLPPSWVFAWTSRSPRRIRRFCRDQIEWVSWAVETVGASPWMQALCLPRAVAAQCMLRRRGVASRLCLGVVRQDNALIAHAWIEIGQDMIVGGAAARGFTKIAEFGKEAA
jgi:hypothetical protein